MKNVMVAIMAFLAIGTLWGETFTWKFVKRYSDADFASPAWKSFGAVDNWAVGSDKDGINSVSRVPSNGDAIRLINDGVYSYAATIKCIDLDGQDYAVGRLENGEVWSNRHILLKNGTLMFVNSFVNYAARVHVFEGGKFVLGTECASCGGRSSSVNTFDVYANGELDVGGHFSVVLMRMTVNAGGTATLHPTTFAFDSRAVSGNGFSFVRNNGILNLPAGVTLSGSSNTGDNVGPHIIRFEQLAGQMNIGGDFKSVATKGGVDFILGGGVINASEDVAFTGLRTVMMTNDAVATVNVAAGKTLDLTEMSFSPGTMLTKCGGGVVKFGGSVPEFLHIEGGAVEPVNAVRFGTISFSQGGELHLNVAGVTASKVLGAENAALVVGSGLSASRNPFFRVDDESAATVMAEKIESPEGFSVVANTGTLTVERPHDGAVFFWKRESGEGDPTTNDKSYWNFYGPDSWGVGTTINASNDAGWLPGENDEIFYGGTAGRYSYYMWFDMNGGTRKVKGLNMSGAPEKWSERQFRLKNGTLEFSSSFTNINTKVTVEKGGRFVLGDGCFSRMGDGGNGDTFNVDASGEVKIGGDVRVHIMKVNIADGGRFVFAPVAFGYDGYVGFANVQSYIANNGFAELSNGFTLSTPSKGNCTFSINQGAGEMVLGGDVKMESAVDHLDFNLAGGVVRVTGDAAFIGCRNVVMANDAVAEVSVAAEKTADFSAMEFGAGTELAKTGPGALKLGSSLPSALAVNEGSLVLAGGSALGSRLSLGGSAKIVLAGNGITFDAIAGLEHADFSVEPQALANGAALISSADRDALESVLEKIAAQVGLASASRRGVVLAESAAGNGVYELRVFATRGLKVIVK